jgi:hypothetical protein
MQPGCICKYSKDDNKGLLKIRGKVTNNHDWPGMRQKQKEEEAALPVSRYANL